MIWKIQGQMKDKASFRLISIGFISGIVFSGLVLLTINIAQNTLLHYSGLLTPPIFATPINQLNPDPVNGKIDLNQATLSQLETLPGIGETKANAIIDFRQKYGSFETISELSYVPGIGNTLLISIQDLVIIK